MTKISVTGSKSSLQSVIDAMHDLALVDLQDYEGELESGDPFPEAEELSQLLVDVRSLISEMPGEVEPEEVDIAEVEEQVPELVEKTEELRGERETIDREIDSLEEERKFFEKLKGSGLSYSDLEGSESLEVFVGKLDVDKFRAEVNTDRYEVFRGKNASAVIYSTRVSDEVEKALQEASKKVFKVPETKFSGTVEEVVQKVDRKISDLEDEKEEVKIRNDDLVDEWKPKLVYIENYLTEKVEKAEAPLKFATTERTFIARGWIPEEEFPLVQEKLMDAAEGKIHIEKEEVEDEEPPVKHENNRFAQPFESLTDLVAVPKYNEIDPSTVLLLTFPLFFGFMIGDAGYGLTTLAVFYGGYRMFPKAQEIFKSLMYASVATIVFGLAFGDAFGYVIFGHHSELAAVTGIHLFEKIPILFHRAEHLVDVFYISAAIGLVHVNLGYLIGFYNEYVRHGVKEAVLEKGSWIFLQVGIALMLFSGVMVGAPVVLLSLVMLFLGEGIEGIVEVPSLLSNILSYLRIFGVSVAAVALAAVVNRIADIAFSSGDTVGVALGVGILVFGHVFNTFIKIMEGFLQGIRLHYVEMFGKFYEGGGKKYAPFGARGN